jgi:hypothetical protein
VGVVREVMAFIKVTKGPDGVKWKLEVESFSHTNLWEKKSPLIPNHQ